MTDDLAAPLLAAIEEITRVAEDARIDYPPPWHRGNEYSSKPDPEGCQIYDSTGDVVVHDEGNPNGAAAEHIVRQGPDAVLLLCDVHREIVKWYETRRRQVEERANKLGAPHPWAETEALVLETVLRKLARFYRVEVQP